MIAVLTLLYIAALFLAVKLNLIRLTLFWKLSPILWMLFLTVVLFIPMQFYAPAGAVINGQYSVQIAPNVAGQVIEVPVEPNVPLRKGDILFRIESRPFQAAVDDLLAQLALSKTRLGQAQKLAKSGAGSVYEVERQSAQLAQLEANLDQARFNLEQTVVRAPADGYVTNVNLRVGARVMAAPLASVMAFVETRESIIVMQVFQRDLRFIQPDQPAEITFKMFPGKVYTARVVRVMPASAMGIAAPSGLAAAASQVVHAPMWVRLEMNDESLPAGLAVGATGTGAIYTDKGAATQVIRRVMVRMEAIINYLSPM
ncbi:MAG: efflux RND transporter periplasmic adaptor subunit [Pseudomonadota bacterium]|nr:efflux RND transporter periplasmic adaptor subunit [Pseudomonadota bacterium]